MTRWRPSGEGNELLELWALWNRGDMPGRGDSAGWSERLDRATEEQPPEKVIIIDRIVARMGVHYPDYRSAVKRYYLDNQSPWEIAGHMQRTPGFVCTMLDGAIGYVLRQYQALTETAVAV